MERNDYPPSNTVVFVDADSTIIFDYPLFWRNYTVGKKYYTSLYGDMVLIEVISINESVTVKAGTFDKCIKVKGIYDNNSNNEDFYWIRNDIGVIKVEGSQDNLPAYITELKSKNF
jgi:hypothetical protein